MQSAIAEKHTLELGTHQPCTQSLEKVNLDNGQSNNNQSNNIQRLKLDRLRNSTYTREAAAIVFEIFRSITLQENTWTTRNKDSTQIYTDDEHLLVLASLTIFSTTSD